MGQQSARLRVLTAGIFSLILTLGVARFAYTLLLPPMQAQAGLGVGAAGALAAINYAGYLSGALLAMLISDLRLKDRIYRIGLLVAVASTALMGLSQEPWVWAVSRYLGGLSSAAGMLLGAGLVLNWLMRHGHRGELGIHYSGIGLGIVAWSPSWAAGSTGAGNGWRWRPSAACWPFRRWPGCRGPSWCRPAPVRHRCRTSRRHRASCAC